MITTPHRPTPERQTPERPTPECIHLSGISWQTYESLLQELGDRRLRLTYYRGDLEIMSPSPEHELSKEVLGRFVETLAEETDLQIYPLGSTTLKRAEGASGAEPDKCFYVKGIAAVRGKKRLDLTTDPAPDFVIEIDVTSSSQTRLQVYADLGVAEVWVYAETALTVYQLSGDRYQKTTESQFFPNIPIAEIANFLQQSATTDYLDLVKQFRGWVRSQLNSQ
jgi:Uma2 family endonuclease